MSRGQGDPWSMAHPHLCSPLRVFPSLNLRIFGRANYDLKLGAEHLEIVMFGPDFGLVEKGICD